MNDYEFTSTAMVAELKFDVVNMSAVDDFRSFGFEASVEFIRLDSVCDSTHRVYGASGEMRLSAHAPMSDSVSMIKIDRMNKICIFIVFCLSVSLLRRNC